MNYLKLTWRHLSLFSRVISRMRSFSGESKLASGDLGDLRGDPGDLNGDPGDRGELEVKDGDLSGETGPDLGDVSGDCVYERRWSAYLLGRLEVTGMLVATLSAAVLSSPLLVDGSHMIDQFGYPLC